MKKTALGIPVLASDTGLACYKRAAESADDKKCIPGALQTFMLDTSCYPLRKAVSTFCREAQRWPANSRSG
jgi:hypothetical protein